MKKYTSFDKSHLISLFLITGFPLHLWTIVLVFLDFPWLIERTDLSGAIGVLSYALLYALLESGALLLVLIILSQLISRKWPQDRRLAIIGLVYLVAALWGIGGQLFFIQEWRIIPSIFTFLVNSGRPLLFILIGLVALIIPSIIIPTAALIRSRKFEKFFIELLDRLSALTLLYLVFDLLAFFNIVFRNL